MATKTGAGSDSLTVYYSVPLTRPPVTAIPYSHPRTLLSMHETIGNLKTNDVYMYNSYCANRGRWSHHRDVQSEPIFCAGRIYVTKNIATKKLRDRICVTIVAIF